MPDVNPGNSPAQIPVIVGVGQCQDRPEQPQDGLDSLALMAAAARSAADDAGGGWLERIDRVAIAPQTSFSYDDLGAELAAELGLAPECMDEIAPISGHTPIRYLNDAANAVAAGDATTYLIVGAEATRTRRAMASASPGRQPLGANMAGLREDPRYRYGVLAPAHFYPLYENATRAAWNQSLAEGQAETGQTWSLMSQVAANSEDAWMRSAFSAEEILEPSPSNRPIAFPYTKLTVANPTVNQGAAVIVTSLAVAREAGVPEAAIVYVGAGAAAYESKHALDRERWDQSHTMRAALEGALANNGLGTTDLDHVELYSCFPCVPKMARRIIDWPEDKPATVHGGLTFGGAPLSNYMTHAIASMVRTLRSERGTSLLYGMGGYSTSHHAIVLSSDPADVGAMPQSHDAQAAADASAGDIPSLTEDYEGPVTVETYTIVYERDGAPSYGVVLARNPDGDRVIARVDAADQESIAFLTNGEVEPVGAAGVTERRADLLYWKRP